MPSIVCGPSGGIGGTEFHDVVPDATAPGEIRISADRPGFIRSVQFLYVNADGAVIESPYHGLPSDQAGANFAISLGKRAYISQISGRYGKYVDFMQVTTMRDEGGEFPRADTKSFGGPGGAAIFVYAAPPGYEIVGFFGRALDLVDAIGVLFRPLAERGVSNAFSLFQQLPQGGSFGGAGHEPNFGQPEPIEETGSPPSPTNEPMKRSGGPIKPE